MLQTAIALKKSAQPRTHAGFSKALVCTMVAGGAKKPADEKPADEGPVDPQKALARIAMPKVRAPPPDQTARR